MRRIIGRMGLGMGLSFKGAAGGAPQGIASNALTLAGVALTLGAVTLTLGP